MLFNVIKKWCFLVIFTENITLWNRSCSFHIHRRKYFLYTWICVQLINKGCGFHWKVIIAVLYDKRALKLIEFETLITSNQRRKYFAEFSRGKKSWPDKLLSGSTLLETYKVHFKSNSFFIESMVWKEQQQRH